MSSRLLNFTIRNPPVRYSEQPHRVAQSMILTTKGFYHCVGQVSNAAFDGNKTVAFAVLDERGNARPIPMKGYCDA